MQIDYQYAVQDELPLDHEDSLDHWARLLADLEVDNETTTLSRELRWE